MQGQLSKMSCRADTEVQYTLALGDATQDMNALNRCEFAALV